MCMADSSQAVTDSYSYTVGPDKTPSEAVIVAVAEVTDQSPAELPILNDTIDPGALNRLLDTTKDASSPTVTFEYSGYEVTVTPGNVRIEPSSMADERRDR